MEIKMRMKKKFNEPLLNKNKTEHIYLYRVKNGSKTKYLWYGKYEIIGKTKKNLPHTLKCDVHSIGNREADLLAKIYE